MNGGRWLGLALLLSVAVNLLAGGALLGHLLKDSARQPPPPMAWALREMDTALRRELQPRLRARLAGAMPQRTALRRSFRELAMAIRAEPLDRDRASAALSTLRETSRDYQAVLHESMLDILAELPPERREAALRAFMRQGGELLRPGAARNR